MEEHPSKHEIRSIVPEGVLEALAALDDEEAIATILEPKLLTFWRAMQRYNIGQLGFMNVAHEIVTYSRGCPDLEKELPSERKKARAEVNRCFKTLKDISEKYYIETPLFVYPASFTELQIETLFDNMKKEIPLSYDSSMLDSLKTQVCKTFKSFAKDLNLASIQQRFNQHIRVDKDIKAPNRLYADRNYFVIMMTRTMNLHCGTPLHSQVAKLANIYFPPYNEVTALEKDDVRKIIKNKDQTFADYFSSTYQ